MTCYEKQKENISAAKGGGQEDKRERKQRFFFFFFALVLFIASTLKETDSSQPSVSIWIPLDGNAG